MGAWNYLWHFIFSLLLCTKTGMTEGRNVTTATTQIHIKGSVSTEPGGTTGLAAHNSSATTAEPSATTAPSLLDTSFLSPSTMRMVGGEGRTETEPTGPNGEGSSLGASARSDVVSPATPTAGPATTATSMGTGSGTASSLPSSAVTSHSLSSPGGSTAATPNPQRSSTSSTAEEHLATTAHPSTTLVVSTLSSTSGITSVQSAAVTAGHVTHSPTTPRTVASTSGTYPASDTTEASLPSTPGGSTETSAAQHTSAPLTQGQAVLEAGTTPSSMGSPMSPTATASTGNSATTPPGEGESPTINQGSGTTNDPSAETSHSLPDTSLVTPSTPNLKMSTSVNPSVTGTCSPITLSIQLENVTSTVIQFSWKPQGGTGDSPYTVLLRGKSGEMERRILNGTSTAFENLLSGQQYQISVDVSTCSENVSASLAVQTGISSGIFSFSVGKLTHSLALK
ncbi:mucin-2-like [Pseudopipra pipra]|uniref:mucin-2-like n=1 Tax=Pseudopipra pipra TaxID=415032 RepID=UPI00313A3FAF